MIVVSKNNVKEIGGGAIHVHRNAELTLQKITGDNVTVIDASAKAQSIAVNVNQYTVEGVDIHIADEDSRFLVYQFAYVNQHGGTEYVSFSLASVEDLKIKRELYNNSNSRKNYNTEVDQVFTVFSDSMTVEQSRNLKYFWISPKIDLILEGVHYPVNIKSKKEEIKNRASGLIFYNVTFEHESIFNVQK